uniref:PK145R n=1 Tax=African swine fever virus TaxID=10497 RepID=A0A6G7KU08_ASF
MDHYLTKLQDIYTKLEGHPFLFTPSKTNAKEFITLLYQALASTQLYRSIQQLFLSMYMLHPIGFIIYITTSIQEYLCLLFIPILVTMFLQISSFTIYIIFRLQTFYICPIMYIIFYTAPSAEKTNHLLQEEKTWAKIVAEGGEESLIANIVF